MSDSSAPSPLRPATPDDAPRIAEIYAPFCGDSPVSFEIEPPTAAQISERVARYQATHPWLVAEDDCSVLGYVYASPHRDRAAYRWSVDVAAYFDAAFRRRGLGRWMYETLFELLTWQGFHAAHAGITVPNEASVGLHEALGFVLIGIYPAVGYKAGAWRDVGWWQRRLGPRAGAVLDPPGEPVWAATARSDPAWLAILDRANRRAPGSSAQRSASQ